MKNIVLMLHISVTLVLITLSHFVSAENVAINVGATRLEFKDALRPSWDGNHQRPITTHLFYPTYNQTIELVELGDQGEALFVAGEVAWNPEPVNANPLPLIFMSHGTGGSALQMLWLAERLVKNGYLVVGVNHHGNTALEPTQYAEGSVLWWERAQDLKVVLQAIRENETWGPRINQHKIGVIGFSLGGYTAISAIGGITDRALYTTFCESHERDFTCEPQVEFANVKSEFDKVKDSNRVKASLQRQHHSNRIDEIKAAFILAPAVGQAFTEASLQEIAVPVSILVGTQDKITPAATNAKRIASLINNASYSEIEDVGHYTFLSNCTDLGHRYLKALCGDSKEIVRSDIHNDVSQRAVTFFNGVFGYSNALLTEKSPR